MADHSLAEKLDAAWGNPEDWTSRGLHWTHLKRVGAVMARRVSGDAEVLPMAWFLRHVQRFDTLPLRRVLVLGCGAGEAERALVACGWAAEAVAIDLSAKVLAEARRRAGPDAPIHYVQADMNNLPVGAGLLAAGTFDAVFGISSVHHCERLEKLYACVHTLLKPGGWLFLDEYTGPERFQYTAAHMAFINRVADLLPDRLLTTRSGQVRRNYHAPAPDQVIAADPTEAVSSTRIVPALRPWFDVDAVRPYGGGLLQVLLGDVAQNFEGENAPWLEALVQAEDDAIRSGTVPNQFTCVIARARPAGSLEPGPDR